MKTKKSYIIFKTLLLTLAVLPMTSCMDWLDVKPKTSVDEKELFSREEGFMEALTGIYIQMSATDMYGRELSYGLPDKLAQCYEPGGGSDIPQPVFGDEDWYRFPSTKTEGYINSVWKSMYKTIANINNLLMWVEKNRDVLTTENYYEIIKGEALGLRAFLYTDLLRLYGPIFKNAGAGQSPTLPYRTEFNRKPRELSTAEQVTKLIEQDLLAAQELLADDPMYMEFPKSGDPETVGRDPFLTYRYKRMNLYAVKALAARMYLWKGDRVNAAKYAQQVIDAEDQNGNPYFQLVTDNATDRIYSTEIIFSMSVDEFDEQTEKDFAVSPYSTQYYVQDRDRIDQWFDINNDGANDMRYREGQGFASSGKAAYTVKYYQNAMFSEALRNTIPLIRLSEMYYILAECADDLETTRYYLSSIREARGSDELRPISGEDDKLDQLMKEYRKEFYAEGQLWYFYKRNACKTFLFCPLKTDMAESNYRFPLPENELEFGEY